MLRPAPMTRALIVGPRDEMPGLIETLYALRLLHVVDHREGEHEFDIGRPLEGASVASEVLVKLRSIVSVLQVPEAKEPTTGDVSGDLREKILALELNLSEEDSTRKKTQALLSDLQRRIDELGPFAALPLVLEDYRGYENLEVIVGKMSRELPDLGAVTKEHEVFEGSGVVAVFVSKTHAVAMRDALARSGLAPLAVPDDAGSPKSLLGQLTAEKERWEARLADIEDRLTTLRERYAGFLSAAKAHLEIQVEKAEAPLRFAVTDHTFVVEGWVPSEMFPQIQATLGAFPNVYLSELESDGHAADPPVLLRNARPLRPFEMLVKLFSIPSYKEVDPTFIVALGFPLFFGIMIGDAGYGAVWLVLGLWLLTKVKEPGAFRDLIIAVVWGGFFAFVFGMFFFAEAFGIPFHAIEGATGTEAIDWSGILGLSIPFHATIEKLHQVPDFIVLAIAASFLHLAAAFSIGLVNEVGHSKKHAMAKVGWLLILTGLFVIFMVRAGRWPGTMGYTIWNGPLGWFPREGFVMENLGFFPGNAIPNLAVYLAVAGIGLLLVTEGGLAIMEVFGLMANMISYARLAAVGVAKAAMAFAFNVIVYENFILPWQEGGSVALVPAGLAVGFVLHLILFFLGGLSAGIQALRLNYVEFFIKFFKGSGTLFRPFGTRTKPEV